MGEMYSKHCKVCNSVYRNIIEELSLGGFNPQKVYSYLQSIQDPQEQAIIQKEDINPSSIRRHIDNHFKKEEAAQLKIAETHNRIEKSREMLNTGVSITVDKVNSLCHMIDTSLIKLEEIEGDASINNKTKYQLTIQYMNTARGLIESLAKLTGELKQEGTIDINFFSNEISAFTDIVLESIRNTDKALKLNGEIERQFALEFQQQWESYKQRQVAVINSEMKPPAPNLVNNFNDGY